MKKTGILNIEFIGTIDLDSLPESERKTFYSTLLARIQELYQNSKTNEERDINYFIFRSVGA